MGQAASPRRGEASAFTLELPPYRIPNVGHILYTSLIDRTLFVLWRAIQTAAPAGAVIWILGNTQRRHHVGVGVPGDVPDSQPGKIDGLGAIV
jgi:Fe2+ transport system protein B